MHSPSATQESPGAPAPDAPPHRVAFLISAADVSGSARQLVGTVVGLRERGVPVRVVITQRRGHPESLLRAHLAERGVDVHLAEERGPFDPRLVGSVRRALEPWGPTVLETHGYKPHVVGWALRRAGAPWAWVGLLHGLTAENAKVRLYHQLGIKALSHADRVVVMSEGQRALFPGQGDRVRVIFNAVLPLAEDEGPPPDLDGLPRPLIGVIGRLSPEKGVDVFLEALARAARDGAPHGAALAGGGPEREALTARAARLGVEDRVRFLGPVRSMRALYGALDLVVIPSRSEGLPNVLLEAIDAGLPVISTRVGSVPEVLEGSRAGTLVDVKDPDALAEAIRTLDLTEDRSAARSAIMQRFTNDRKVESYLALYREVSAARSEEP